jgi:hypothetical protein
MEFILLMDRIKYWYNTPLQVLTVAPALHSLNICLRHDAEDIVKFLDHNHVDLKKLYLQNCSFDMNASGLVANIVDFCPGLECLSMRFCFHLSPADLGLIPRLKKLSELNVLGCKVTYACGKLLESQVCIPEHM